MKRVGGYLKSILPLVTMLGIQFAASTVQMIRFMVQYGVEEGTQIYMNDTMTILLISDVLLLGVAGLWYYISVVRRREKYGIRETSLFQKKDLIGLLLMAVGAQFLIGILMSGWEVLDPKSMQEYTDLIEGAGLGESGISAILATVIIGISLIRFFTSSKAAQGLRKVKGLRFLATPQGTTAVLLGSILYKFCIQIAINAGLPANMLKFITAVLFLLVLVLAGRKGEEIIHA